MAARRTSAARRWSSATTTPLEQVVAIGDSRSDVRLFEAVGFNAALNATPAARAVASMVVA